MAPGNDTGGVGVGLRQGILLIGIGLALGIGGWTYLHSAASSVSPITPVTPDDGARCAACHEEHVGYWRQGGHGAINCDVCQGPPGDHLTQGIDPRPELLIKGPEHCLECHLRQEGEPMATLWIEHLEHHLKAIEKKHVTTIDRARVAGRCSFCHEPHSLE